MFSVYFHTKIRGDSWSLESWYDHMNMVSSILVLSPIDFTFFQEYKLYVVISILVQLYIEYADMHAI